MANGAWMRWSLTSVTISLCANIAVAAQWAVDRFYETVVSLCAWFRTAFKEAFPAPTSLSATSTETDFAGVALARTRSFVERRMQRDHDAFSAVGLRLAI